MARAQSELERTVATCSLCFPFNEPSKKHPWEKVTWSVPMARAKRMPFHGMSKASPTLSRVKCSFDTIIVNYYNNKFISDWRCLTIMSWLLGLNYSFLIHPHKTIKPKRSVGLYILTQVGWSAPYIGTNWVKYSILARLEWNALYLGTRGGKCSILAQVQ